MDLTPLTKKSDIKAAYSALMTALKGGASKYRRVVGWKGGNAKFDVYWHPQRKFWVFF